MTKRKPMFKERIGYAMHDSNTVDGKGQWCAGPHRPSLQWTRVTVQDARRPSALKAVERVLQDAFGAYPIGISGIEACATAADMIAKIVNGRVTCQWMDK